MSEPLAHTWTVAHGESLDIAIDAPMTYAEGEGDPRTDGSVFALSFKIARGDVETFLAFNSAYGNGSLALGDYEAGKLTLSFSASAAEVMQLPPGAYVGDLIQERPRTGALGPERRRLAIITLNVEGKA